MNIENFCKDHTDDELEEIKRGLISLNGEVIKNWITPDHMPPILKSLQEQNVLSLGEEILEICVAYTINNCNIEIIEKELFRRSMENDSR